MSRNGEAVFVRDGQQWVSLLVNDIPCMEADDNSTHVHTLARKYTVGRMLKEVLQEVANERMERVHRSYAENLERMQAVSDNGLHVGDRRLPIGRSFKSEVMRRLRVI